MECDRLAKASEENCGQLQAQAVDLKAACSQSQDSLSIQDGAIFDPCSRPQPGFMCAVLTIVRVALQNIHAVYVCAMLEGFRASGIKGQWLRFAEF